MAPTTWVYGTPEMDDDALIAANPPAKNLIDMGVHKLRKVIDALNRRSSISRERKQLQCIAAATACARSRHFRQSSAL